MGSVIYYTVIFGMAVFVYLLVLVGVKDTLGLLIDLAAQLEPNPKHTNHFESMKGVAATLAHLFAVATVLLAFVVGAIAHGYPLIK